jgi:hypothetical protein
MPQRQFTLRRLMIVVGLCAVWLVMVRHTPWATIASTATIAFLMLGSTSATCVNRLSSTGASAHLVFGVVIASLACYFAGVYSAVVAVGLIFGL